MIRRHRFAFAFLTLLVTMLFVAPLAKREVFQLRDHFDYFQPLRWFTAQELRAGHIPFWNPYSSSGEPWFSNPQTGVFYPPSWMFLVLPFETAYMLFLLLHLVVLACGTYLLLVRRVSPGAALLGAAALTLSGPLLSLVDISNNLATFAWIPLVLWCAAEGAWRRGGVVLALAFLGGEPFFAAVAALLYVIVRRRRDVFGTALIAFGLSAVQLLPFLEMIVRTDRAGEMGAEDILRQSMTWGEWVRVVVPPQLIDAPPVQTFLPVVYGGVVVTLLAVIGLTTLRRRHDLVAWLALAAAAMVVSTGPLWLARLPLTLFRYPARLVPLAVLALVVLAAAGWDRIRADKRWLDLVVVLIVIGDLLPHMTQLLESGSFRTDVVPYDRSIGASHQILRVEPDERRRRESIGGYLNLYDRRFDTFTGAPFIDRAYLHFYFALQSIPSQERLSAAAIGYVLTPRALAPSFRELARRGGTAVYAVPNPRTLAAAVAGDRVIPLPVEIDTSRVRVTVELDVASIVTVAQRDDPALVVTIDGEPARKRSYFEIFRAVDVPPGRHEIVWTYRPKTFFFGAGMTLVTLLAMTLPIFVKRTR